MVPGLKSSDRENASRLDQIGMRCAFSCACSFRKTVSAFLKHAPMQARFLRNRERFQVECAELDQPGTGLAEEAL
jgi:hypothetical protein